MISVTGKGHGSLKNQLVLWFLIFGLVPLIVVALVSYQTASSRLTQIAADELHRTAIEKITFIKNWFGFREMDLERLNQDEATFTLLASLIEGYSESGQTLQKYIESYDWVLRVDSQQSDLVITRRTYDYIYDLFLIDNQGNILYTIEKENDLGTNLLVGELANTRFAQSVRQTMATGKNQFSDIERYAPSNNALSCFLTTLIVDSQGEKLGVLAVQIKYSSIRSLLLDDTTGAFGHYLVGEDGLLRTSLKGSEADVLNRHISTDQFKLWVNEHVSQGIDGRHQHEEAFDYIGPEGNTVIGLHQTLYVNNVRWALISEADRNTALAPVFLFNKIIVILVLLTAVVIVLFTFRLAKRITQPLIELADVSDAIAKGAFDLKADIASNNEIGLLAAAFNRMQESRQIYEREIQRSSRKIERTLEELNEQRFALAHHAIVAITDVKGTILYANDKFAEISGYSVSEIIGKNHRILNSGFHSLDFFREMYLWISKGIVWKGEICNKAKDGHLYWVDTTIAPFKGDDGKIERYIAIRTDITERKLYETNLLKAKEEAETAARAKSEFLASMSHEIRTPMNGVLGMLGLLLRGSLDTVQQHRAQLAQSSALSLLTLINDILDFSKIEAGKMEVDEIEFNLPIMLGEFVESMAHRAQEKDLELILDVTRIKHNSVRGDPGRIRQILNNLVGNAIKFTEAGGDIVLKAELEPVSATTAQFICSVKDTGIGIPENKLNHIFDSFTQVDTSTTRKFGGTGLGLAIVKQLSQLQGGDVEVTSTLGKGSCFKFNIQLGLGESAQAELPKVEISGMHMLVVDDNETNREVLRDQLEIWGATVAEAASGQQALEMLQASVNKPNEVGFKVAFLDMQMPEMDGAQLGTLIRDDARLSEVKLVMMTSIVNRGDAAHFANIGFDAYFPKPVTMSDLFDALGVVLQNGEARKMADPLVTQHYVKSLAPAGQVGLTDASTSDTVQWPAGSRILLAEDNVINQTVVQGILEELGLRCDIAANGSEAIDMLNAATDSAPFSIVLMDCQMPSMDGYKATQSIRQGDSGDEYRKIPIIALTANAMQGDKEKCLASGMNDYMSKPIDAVELKHVLIKWMLNSDSSEGPDTVVAEKPLIVWDQVAAMRRVGGKKKRLKILIDLFLASIPENRDELKQAFDQQDAGRIAKVAHTLKGVAGNLGADALMSISAETEQLAKSNDLVAAKAAYNLLLARLDQLELEFREYSEALEGQ